jgi:hypothetical protein
LEELGRNCEATNAGQPVDIVESSGVGAMIDGLLVVVPCRRRSGLCGSPLLSVVCF